MNKRAELGVVSESGEIQWIVWKKGIPWWRKISFTQIFQVVFGIVTMIALIFGMIFFVTKEWHASAISFAIAFFCMFVLWQIEHMTCFYLKVKLRIAGIPYD